MDFDSVMQLKELIVGDEEQQEYQPSLGSVLNPGEIGGGEQQKDVAKPFAQMEIKAGQRPKEETQTEPNKGDKTAPQKKDKNDIWDSAEVQELPVNRNDPRERPDFDVLFKQKVGTEDVFLGMGDMDPTSTKCKELVMKIQLPNTQTNEIQLEITKDSMLLQTPKFYLHHYFPYPVKDKEGKAQFISDKFILQLTFTLVREELF